MGEAAAIPSSTSAGSSSRIPRMPTASAIAAKFGFWSSVPNVRNPVELCSNSMKPSAPLLREGQKFTHQHGEAAIAGERAAREGGLSADPLRHRFRHRTVPERADEPPFPVHREVSVTANPGLRR